MMTSLSTSIVLATVWFTLPATAMAELYKCPSKTGGIEYSDTPCANAARRDGDRWINVDAERRQKEAEARREKERLNREATSIAPQQSPSSGNDLFGQPQRLCSALASEVPIHLSQPTGCVHACAFWSANEGFSGGSDDVTTART